MSTTATPTAPNRQQTMTRGIMKAFTPVHRWVLRVSRGRIGQGWSTTSMSLLLLTTTGRRSGKPRTTVVGYIEEGDALVVIASKGGLPEHPAWYYNLVANPEVTVERDGTSTQMRARVAEGEERDRLWKEISTLEPTFVGYQAGVSRRIPVVVLEQFA